MVARYDKVDQHEDDGGGASMELGKDGDWVKYSDYESLEARVEELKRTVAYLDAENDKLTDIKETEDRMNELREALAAHRTTEQTLVGEIEHTAAQRNEYASRLEASVKAHNEIFDALRESEEKLNAKSLRLGVYLNQLRVGVEVVQHDPHGGATANWLAAVRELLAGCRNCGAATTALTNGWCDACMGITVVERQAPIAKRGLTEEEVFGPGAHVDIHGCGCRFPNGLPHDRVYTVPCPSCYKSKNVVRTNPGFE